MVSNEQLIYSSIHVLYTLGARDFSYAVSGFGQIRYMGTSSVFLRAIVISVP